MRTIVNSTYITLDRVIENPHLWPSTADDGGEGEANQSELLMSCDAVLMGRRTYEGFAPVWQTRSGDAYSVDTRALKSGTAIICYRSREAG